MFLLSGSSQWHLRKIPKVLHLYWGGENMSFLRFLTVVSFRQYNPDWKIKIHRPKQIYSGDITWKTHEHATSRLKIKGQYASRLEEYGVEFVEHDFEQLGFTSNLPETYKADFIRWGLLGREGGVWSDFDIVYFRPMTKLDVNKKENAEVDTGLCPYANGVHAIGFLFSAPGNPFFLKLEELSKVRLDPNQYQSIGSTLFSLPEMYPKRFPINYVLIHPNGVYFLGWQQTKDIFINNVTLPANAIGIHWYAGDLLAQQFDARININNVGDFNNTICNTIVKYISIKPTTKMTFVSIIMPSFKRAELLRWGLFSIARQKIGFDYEIIVLNDGVEDDTEAVCKTFSKKLNIKYLFTGQRNKDGVKPRVPGFAINIGVKQAKGDVVILTCPEVFHIQDNTLNLLIEAVQNNPLALAAPREVVDDFSGVFLEHVKFNFGDFDKAAFHNLFLSYKNIINESLTPFVSNRYMPYLMAMQKSHFMDIGGYDEDFIGIAADDNDIMDRLLANGCEYNFVKADVVHLYHGPKLPNIKDERYLYNVKLWKDRKGVIQRNENRTWGEF